MPWKQCSNQDGLTTDLDSFGLLLPVEQAEVEAILQESGQPPCYSDAQEEIKVGKAFPWSPKWRPACMPLTEC